MPEGHVVHRLAHRLVNQLGGQITRAGSPQGRFTAGAQHVDGRRLAGADAYGKHLFVEFAEVPERVHVHLGIYGKFTFLPGTGHDVVGKVRWRLTSAEWTVDLRGPAICELLDPGAVDAVLDRPGPDPVRLDADPERAWRRISTSQTPIAVLLMDQRVVSGVGNIYRAEVLFRQRLDPRTPGRSIDRATWDAIWADLRELMAAGVSSGRIDTVREEHLPEAMGRPAREDRHGGEVYVYRRAGQPCHVCGTAVRSGTLAARNLFWCDVCQMN